MAALDLMAGVTVDLGHTAITDPLTAVVAVVALLVWRPNTAWLVLAGAAIGIAHPTHDHQPRATRRSTC